MARDVQIEFTATFNNQIGQNIQGRFCLIIDQVNALMKHAARNELQIVYFEFDRSGVVYAQLPQERDGSRPYMTLNSIMHKHDDDDCGCDESSWDINND